MKIVLILDSDPRYLEAMDNKLSNYTGIFVACLDTANDAYLLLKHHKIDLFLTSSDTFKEYSDLIMPIIQQKSISTMTYSIDPNSSINNDISKYSLLINTNRIMARLQPKYQKAA